MEPVCRLVSTEKSRNNPAKEIKEERVNKNSHLTKLRQEVGKKVQKTVQHQSQG